MIFDTHAHYDDRAFDEDRDEVISTLEETGVGRIVHATSPYGPLAVSMGLAERYEQVYSSAGLHPTEIYDLDSEIALHKVEEMCSHPKVVAIGEIGLDYHYDDTDEALQKAYFDAQLEMSLRLDMPVIIHSRDAAADTLEFMRNHAKKGGRGVIHCFSYSYEMAAEYVKMGYFIGIGGVVTFKNARKVKEIATKIPLEYIVLETDCPYLAPVPHRGERNCSIYLDQVAKEIATLRGITAKEVRDTTWNNGCRLYGMKN
jgi:TatD DNase family protein